MLAQRLASAAVGIPIILGLVLLGGIPYDVTVAIILAIASLEFCAMVRAPETPPRPLWRPLPWEFIAPAAAAAMVEIAPEVADDGTGDLAVLIAAVMTVLVLRAKPLQVQPWAAVPIAILYVGFLGAHLVPLRDLDDDGHWVLLAIFSTWGADTFAYSAGKLAGRHKMAPSISPGKTWEGTAGGLLGGLATVVVVNLVLDLPISTGEALLLGAILPAVAVIADLGESLLKRGAGVKDTSELVPGHGGLLDRLDSLLCTVPLVYYFAVWVVI